MRSVFAVSLCVFIAATSLAAGDQPIDALRRGVDEGLQILQNPGYKAAEKKDAQQQKLWAILERLFDFHEFSKRVLASNWKDFTPAQRQEFVRVFSDFLGKFYLGKLQEKYKDEALIFAGQTLTSPSQALVNVRVVWKGQNIPVDLQMLKRKGLWRVYDIEFLGISAVKNYRAQFQFILQTETPARVIERLKLKIEALEKKDQKE